MKLGGVELDTPAVFCLETLCWKERAWWWFGRVAAVLYALVGLSDDRAS